MRTVGEGGIEAPSRLTVNEMGRCLLGDLKIITWVLERFMRRFLLTQKNFILLLVCKPVVANTTGASCVSIKSR